MKLIAFKNAAGKKNDPANELQDRHGFDPGWEDSR